MKKKHFILTILLLVFIPLFVHAKAVKLEEIDGLGEPMTFIDSFDGYFIKNDDEGNPIDNAEFKQTTFNNVFEYQIPLTVRDPFTPSLNSGGGPVEYHVPTVKSGINGTYQYLGGIQTFNILSLVDYTDLTYLTEDTITKKLNGVNHEIRVRYYKQESEGVVFVIGYLYYDGSNLSSYGVITYDFPQAEFESASENEYKKDLNNYISIIKGTDNKEYFVIHSFARINNSNILLILDDEKAIGYYLGTLGAKIASLSGTDSELFYYDNKYNAVKIDTNRIRFFLPTEYQQNQTTIALREFVLTINESELYVEELYDYEATSTTSFQPDHSHILYNAYDISPYDFLTSSQKTMIDNLKTAENYEALEPNLMNSDSQCSGKNQFINIIKKSNGFSGDSVWPVSIDGIAPITSTDSGFSGGSGRKRNGGYVDLYATSFMKIEETKTPKGLEKVSAIAPITVGFHYKVDSDGFMTLIGSEFRSYNVLLKYDPSINYDNLEEAFRKIDDSHVIGYGCDAVLHPFDYNCNNGDPILDDTVCKPFPVIVDTKSDEDLSAKLEIESLVNGKGKVSVNKNSEVTITVKLTNTAKTPSYENVIKSYVPNGLTFIEGSALKGGVYDNEAGTVTWELEYLDAESVELFTYKVKVPSTAKDDTVYKSTATVTNADFDTPIVSDEAKVDVGGNVVNPKTGSFSDLMLLMLLAVSLVIFLAVSQRKRIQNLG